MYGINLGFFLDGTGEAVALGFQHYILCLGTAVMIPTFLVPLMGGNAVRIFLLFNNVMSSFPYLFFLNRKYLSALCKLFLCLA